PGFLSGSVRSIRQTCAQRRSRLSRSAPTPPRQGSEPGRRKDPIHRAKLACRRCHRARYVSQRQGSACANSAVSQIFAGHSLPNLNGRGGLISASVTKSKPSKLKPRQDASESLSADSSLPITSDDSNRLSYFRLSGEQT